MNLAYNINLKIVKDINRFPFNCPNLLLSRPNPEVTVVKRLELKASYSVPLGTDMQV